MKKYMLLLALTLMLMTLIFTYAYRSLERSVTVNTVTLEAREVKSYVSCTGKLEEVEKKDIYVSVPVMAYGIEAEVGDQVEAGQLLFHVNQAATQAMLSYGSMLSGSTGGTQSVNAGSFNEDDLAQAIDNVPDAIYAPIGGTVTGMNVSEDGLTNPAQAVATISDLSKLQVRVSIQENQIGNVSLGQEVSISGVGLGDREYVGHIIKIYPAARQQLTGTNYQTVVDAIVSIDNLDEHLKPNLSVKARILTSPASQGLVLPYEIIRQDERENEYVYIVVDGQARKAVITTGRELEEGVEILSGLAPGHQVITTPDRISGSGDRVIVAGGGENHD